MELKTIQSEVGITFVYVTHDQDEALTMSDRIAVFNEGRIEQVSPPVELYEHPRNEFVAGFVGVSNLIERGGGRLTIRPEKIQLLEPGSAVDGLHSERGRVAEVAYAGMVTRYTVALDAGGELQLVRQNVEGASQRARRRAGEEVLVGWRPEHAAAVRGKSTNEEDITMRRRDGNPARTAWLVVAGLVVFMLALAGCGSSSSDSTRGGEEMQKVGKGEGQLNLISWAGYVEPEWSEAVRSRRPAARSTTRRRHLRRNGRS